MCTKTHRVRHKGSGRALIGILQYISVEHYEEQQTAKSSRRPCNNHLDTFTLDIIQLCMCEGHIAVCFHIASGSDVSTRPDKHDIQECVPISVRTYALKRIPVKSVGMIIHSMIITCSNTLKLETLLRAGNQHSRQWSIGATEAAVRDTGFPAVAYCVHQAHVHNCFIKYTTPVFAQLGLLQRAAAQSPACHSSGHHRQAQSENRAQNNTHNQRHDPQPKRPQHSCRNVMETGAYPGLVRSSVCRCFKQANVDHCQSGFDPTGCQINVLSPSYSKEFDHTKGFPGEGPSQFDQRGIVVCSVNANCWKTFQGSTYPKLGRPLVILVQETKLTHTVRPDGESTIGKAERWCAKQGYDSIFEPSRTTAFLGLSCGTGIMWRKDLGAVMIKEGGWSHRAIMAMIHLPGIGDTVVASCYGNVTDHHDTKSMVDHIAKAIALTGKPYIVGGDWNVEPHVSADWWKATSCPHVVCGSNMSTCRAAEGGSELDYVIVHPKIAMISSEVQLVAEGSSFPHTAVQISIMCNSVQVKVNILDRPRRADLTGELGPERRLEAQTDQLLLNIDDLTVQSNLGAEVAWTTDPSKDQWNKYRDGWDQWCRVAQAELAAKLSQSIRVPMKLPIVCRPISSLFPTSKTSRALPSHGIQWFMNRISELSSLVKNLIKMRTGQHNVIEQAKLKSKAAITLKNLKVLLCPKRLTTFVTNIGGLVRNDDHTENKTHEVHTSIRDKTLQVLKQSQVLLRSILSRGHKALDDTSSQQLCQASAQLREYFDIARKVEWGITKLSYSEFQDKALDKGAKIAHLITKVCPEFPKAEKRLSLQQELAQEELKLHKLWRVEQEAPSFRKEIVEIGGSHTIQAIRKVSSSFPSATSCTDGLHVNAIQLLSDPLLAILAKLYRLAEAYGGYPSELAQMLIKMIPKTDGTCKPIVLFRSVYRNQQISLWK